MPVQRSGSATAQPLIADPETEPHKYEMQILAMYNLSSSSTSSTDDKILGKIVIFRSLVIDCTWGLAGEKPITQAIKT